MGPRSRPKALRASGSTQKSCLFGVQSWWCQKKWMISEKNGFRAKKLHFDPKICIRAIRWKYKKRFFSKSPHSPIFKFFVVTLDIILQNLAPTPAPVNFFFVLPPSRTVWGHYKVCPPVDFQMYSFLLHLLLPGSPWVGQGVLGGCASARNNHWGVWTFSPPHWP